MPPRQHPRSRLEHANARRTRRSRVLAYLTRSYTSVWSYDLPSFIFSLMLSVICFLSSETLNVPSETVPSGIVQRLQSSAVLKLAFAPGIPTSGLSVPSGAPLQLVLQVFP